MSAAAAVIIAAKERRVVEAFVRAGATTPDTAQPLLAIGIADGRAVHRLQNRAVIRHAAPGTFYIDLEVWQAVRRARLRILLVLAIMALAAAILVGVFGARNG